MNAMMNGQYPDSVKTAASEGGGEMGMVSAKAPRHAISADADAREVLTSFLSATIEHFELNLDGVRRGDAGSIKQFRIGLRRFRSIVSLYRKDLPDASVCALRADAKRLGNVLGACRDLDVFVDETLVRAMEHAPGALEARALGVLQRAARRERNKARHAIERLASGRQLAGFVGDVRSLESLAAAAPAKRLDAPANGYAVKMLDKRWKKVRRTGADLAGASPGARHPLRIELKKLRYALHAFRPLYRKSVRKPYLSSLSALQDAFGSMNDAVVARDMAMRVASATNTNKREETHMIEAGTGYVIGWTQGQLDGKAEAVLSAWHDFEAMPPFWREKR